MGNDFNNFNNFNKHSSGEKVSNNKEPLTGKKHLGGSQSMLGEGNVVTSVISV